MFLYGTMLLHPHLSFGNTQESIINIPLPPTTDYTLENKGQELYLSFSQPQSLENIIKTLPPIVRKAQTTPNGLILSFAKPITAQNIRENGNLKITIKNQEPLPSLKNKNSVLTNDLKLSYGEHTDFSRFTFEFAPQQKPKYKVNAFPEETIISFETSPNIIPLNISKYSQAGRIMRQNNTLGGLDIIFPARLVKSFEHNNKIVLDLNLTSSQSDAPSQENITAQKSVPINKLTQTLSESKSTALTSAQISEETTNQVASLSFSWNMPVGLSVFERGGYIWIIFDHMQTVDIENLQKTAMNLADEVIQLPHPNATVIRIHPKIKVNSYVRKEGLLWIVDLFTKDLPEEGTSLPIYTQYNIYNQPYLFVPSSAAGDIISLIDPEIGDLIVTGTSMEVGLGIKEEYKYPDLTLLETIQGIAFSADTTDIALSRGNTGYTIQAIRRGLNISPNLELLKHQKQLTQTEGEFTNLSTEFDKELLGKSFIETEDQLKQEIIQADKEQKDKAILELAKYYISQGLGTNALGILKTLETRKSPLTSTERYHGMLGAANFLAGRYSQAAEEFSYGKLPEINEAVFWRTLSLSAQDPSAENNAVLVSYLNLVRNYPLQIRKAIARIGARTAISAGDDLTAQSFIDILKIMNKPYLQPEINYLTAEKMLMQGYPRNAIQEYRKAANSNDLKYSSLSRKKIADLEIRLNVIPPIKAIEELEGLRYAWGEIEFKKQLLSDLSNLYVRNYDYKSALNTLDDLKKISSVQEKPKVERRQIKLFEDIYLNNQADNLSALKALALYIDYSDLAPKSKNYHAIIQKLADRLVAVDLLDRAYNLLEERLKSNQLTKIETATYGSRMALIELFRDNNHEALKILETTQSSDIPQTLKLQRRIIKAKALAGTGQEKQALDLLKDDFSKNALLLKSEIFWKGGLWGNAADSIKYLIEPPTPGKALSEEQINYILDWATALKKAGRETVVVRLRNKFMPYFQGTKYYSVFSVLTNTLEDKQLNIRNINQAVNDIETFSNFAKIYNQALIGNTVKDNDAEK